MAKKKESGMTLNNPYNEVASKDPNSPDISGAGLYADYEEVMGNHLKAGDMESTPNAESGQGIMGGPAPGEPNPAGVKSTGD